MAELLDVLTRKLLKTLRKLIITWRPTGGSLSAIGADGSYMRVTIYWIQLAPAGSTRRSEVFTGTDDAYMYDPPFFSLRRRKSGAGEKSPRVFQH